MERARKKKRANSRLVKGILLLMGPIYHYIRENQGPERKRGQGEKSPQKNGF
jgi:hypothetical protein